MGLITKITTGLLVLVAATGGSNNVAFGQSDYLDPLVAPATIYEATELSPQNMDYDMENMMFVAHSGWYNDQLIHYYKFRIYAPGTYPDVVTPGGSSAQVPLQKVYFMTTTGDFDGVVGKPIIEYHTSDGVSYSDFMNVIFVDAPTGYVADTFKSVGDIMADSSLAMTDSNIVLNFPVVPTGSVLQDPIEKGTMTAPIEPSMVWYKGVEVQTYIFEVTDASAAAYFADTRPSDTTAESRQDTGQPSPYGIPVVPTFATPTFVSAISIWHVNQFSTGVMEGMGGGPDPDGMRNVINLDRADAGYSPLWNILWATEMPINYSADQFSNAEQGTEANGFIFMVTPMYVNCPDIGPIGEMNALKAESFETSIVIMNADDSFTIIGSLAPFTADTEVSFMTESGIEIAMTMTNMMGAYEYTIPASEIPDGTMEIQVMSGGEVIRTIPVSMEDGSSGAGSIGGLISTVLFASITVMTALLL